MPSLLPYSVFKEPTLAGGVDRVPNPPLDVKRNLSISSALNASFLERFRLTSIAARRRSKNSATHRRGNGP